MRKAPPNKLSIRLDFREYYSSDADCIFKSTKKINKKLLLLISAIGVLVSACSAMNVGTKEQYANKSFEDYINIVPGSMVTKYPQDNFHPYLVKREKSGLPGDAINMNRLKYYESIYKSFDVWCSSNNGSASYVGTIDTCKSNINGEILGGVRHQYVALMVSPQGNPTVGEAYYYFYDATSFSQVSRDANFDKINKQIGEITALKAKEVELRRLNTLSVGDAVCAITQTNYGPIKVTGFIEQLSEKKFKVSVNSMQNQKNQFLNTSSISYSEGAMTVGSTFWTSKEFWSGCSK